MPHLQRFLQTEIVWELETDLKNLARHYHKFLNEALEPKGFEFSLYIPP
ncbi:Transcription regulator, TetR/AcrR [Bacillus cereus Rock3-44]|nr:Transcription regulator, TetR/AcrR [Bacillus cereus Rock3-44]